MGYTECSGCLSGTYSLGSASACFNCLGGTFSQTQAITCDQCNAGTYAPAQSGACSPCQPGGYSLWEASACSPCPVGRFSGVAGVSECTECAAGTWTVCGFVNAFDSSALTFTTNGIHGSCSLSTAGLDSRNGWCATINNVNVYYLVLDARSVGIIDSVTTQGRADYDQWVTAYDLSYSLDSVTWVFFGNLVGNTDTNSKVTRNLNVIARYLRLTPTATKAWPSMRAGYSATPGLLFDQPCTGTSACTLCATGKYKATTGGTTMGVCVDCPEGTFSTTEGAPTSGLCTGCAAGKYSPSGGSQCWDCPANLYSDARSGGCTACPLLSGSAAGSSLDKCECQAGYLRVWEQNSLLWFTCSRCAVGQYTAGAGTGACIACAEGKYGGVSQGSEAAACTTCPTGTFSSMSGASTCSECSKGYYAPSTGSTTCSMCLVGTIASAVRASVCVSCVAGSYIGTDHASACSLCIVGMYAGTAGRSICQTCVAGTYAELTGRTECTKCGAGKYSSIAGQDTATKCVDCSIGYYLAGTGASSSAACLRCAAGTTSPVGGSVCTTCTATDFPDDLRGACASCPYRSLVRTGLTRPEQCVCGPGYYIGYNARAMGGVEGYSLSADGVVTIKTHTFGSHDQGILLIADAYMSISCSGVQLIQPYQWASGWYPPVATQATCPLPMVMSYPVDVEFNAAETKTHMQCVGCPLGTFSVSGGGLSNCLTCPTGQYQDTTGQSACKPCPSGSIGGGVGGSCNPCFTGTYQSGNVCLPCDTGYYTPNVGASVCSPCAVGTWSNIDSGGCRTCPSGSTSLGGTGPQGCLCDAGLTLVIPNGLPVCQVCPMGSYSVTRTNLCELCAAGKFGNTTGASACTPCQKTPAWIATALGNTVCTMCTAGKIAGDTQEACIPCPRAQVCLGNDTIVSCPTGSFAPNGTRGYKLLGECLRCPNDYFCKTPIQKEMCPLNTYSQQGAYNKHMCYCLDTHTCQYSSSTQASVTVSMSLASFEQLRAEFIRSIAAAAGVPIDKVQIVSVQSSSMRRVLRSKADMTLRGQINGLVIKFSGRVGQNKGDEITQAIRKMGVIVQGAVEIQAEQLFVMTTKKPETPLGV